ncbi:hypothetical protein HMN09_01097400 [Mycena chlorophos]|uniref:DUF6593 domain-containing protein n=1 Tax=Mycena chlorophos TaxID=658473 RepID=A0A8H6VYA3_MYCCL|nr:hypothetical protein HMN09_01097400 [Mycena chlorophos]
MFNPYANGIWPNAAAGSSNPTGTQQQPSIFGALPYPTPPGGPPPVWMTFKLSAFNPTILNCTVTGPQARTYFTARTDTPGQAPGFTILANAMNQPAVVIEWTKPHPVLEIRDVVSKRPVGQWLALGEGRKYRTMNVRGKTYVWAPEDDNISLYSAGLGTPQTYARIYRDEDEVILQMTVEAVQIGLLEACVAAALLLQCGRNID